MPQTQPQNPSTWWGESARPEAQSNFFFYWKRALPQLKKEGPPEHLILTLLHKLGVLDGSSLEDFAQKELQRRLVGEVEREERKKGPQHKACRTAWRQWSQQDYNSLRAGLDCVRPASRARQVQSQGGGSAGFRGKSSCVPSEPELTQLSASERLFSQLTRVGKQPKGNPDNESVVPILYNY